MAPFSWARWLRSLFRPKTKTIRRASATLRLEFLENRLAPATYTWTGAGVNNLWSNAANWSNNLPGNPVQAPSGTGSDDLDFPNGALHPSNFNNLTPGGGTAQFNSISIAGSNYTLDGFPVLLGSTSALGAISDGAAGINDLIKLNIQLGGPSGTNQFITVNNAGFLTISGQISATNGNTTISKEGLGTLVLSADNSAFTGNVKLDTNSGIVIITTATALGAGGGFTTVSSGSQLEINNVTTGPINENLILTGAGPAGSGALFNGAGNNTWSGNVYLDTPALSNTTIGAAATSSLSITGTISDLSGGSSSSLTKQGPGQIIFASANSYNDLTYVNDGILTIEDPLGLGTGVQGTVVNQGVATAGTLQLQAPALGPNSGGFVVLNESLILNGGGAASAGTVPFGVLGALSSSAGNNEWAGPVQIGSPWPTGSNVDIGVAANSTLIISGVISDPPPAAPPLFTPPNAPPFSLTKVDAGELIFNNANTYLGNTIVASGILNVRDSNALGPANKSIPNTSSTIFQAPNGATEQGNTVTIRTTNPHGFVPGQYVVITGMGNAYDGTWLITTVPSPTTFTYTDPIPYLNPTGGGIASITNNTIAASPLGATETGHSVTITTNTPHSFVAGENVVISGVGVYNITATGAKEVGTTVTITTTAATGLGVGQTVVITGMGVPGYNGTFTITSTPTPTTFTYTAVAGLGASGGGIVTDPTVAGYNGTFHVTSVPSATTFTYSDTQTGMPNSGGGQVAVADGTIVNAGATLQLEVDGLAGQVDPHGRPLGVDSVTGVANKLIFSQPLDLNGGGVNNIGALDSLSGSNVWSGLITLDTQANNVNIGVEADPNQKPDNSYFANEYSLTLSNTISDGFGPVPTPVSPPDNVFGQSNSIFIQNGNPDTLAKVGTGQLILPNANTYAGPTFIDAGWITIQDSNALGPNGSTGAPVPGLGDNVQPYVFVNAGAALDLLAKDPTTPITLDRNLILAGSGISHAFSLLNGQGALMNIGGDNTITGDVQLNHSVGIGVEQVFPTLPSELTITGSISDFQSFVIRAHAQSAGLTDTNVIDTGANSGTVSISYIFEPNTIQVIEEADVPFVGTGPIPSNLTFTFPAVGLAGSTALATTGFVTGTGTLPSQAYASGTSSLAEIDMAETAPSSQWAYTATFFPTGAGTGGIIKLGSKRLNLQGDGTFTGPVDVRQGVLRVQNDSALGDAWQGTLVTGNNALNQTSTTVEPGAALEIAASVANLNGGLSAGVQTWNDRLILNGQGDTSVQTVAVSGTAGTVFQLTVNGQSTPASGPGTLTVGATAAQLAAALNALSAVNTAGGFATVTQVGNVYTVDFQNNLAGSTNPTLISSPNANGVTVTVDVPISGLTSVSQTQQTFTVTGEAIAASPVGATEIGNIVTITTSAAHNLSVGQVVVISGVGVFNISSSGAQEVGTTATITTTTATGLVPGQTVVIAGVGVGGYNGTFIITSTPTLTSFTYTTVLGLAPSGGGTVTDPTAAGYNGTFQITTVPSLTTFTYTDSVIGLPSSGSGTVASGTFQLTVNGQSTPVLGSANALPWNATPAQVAAALNSLATVNTAGGFATVTETTNVLGNFYTITFQNYFIGSVPTVVLSGAGANGAVVLIGGQTTASSDNLWRGPITLASSTFVDVQADSRLSLFGNIDDSTNLSPAGSDLTKIDTGELVLAGANTYRGATHIGLSQVAFGDATTMLGGIVTIENGQALGTANGGTYVANGSQLQIQGNIIVSGEPLVIQGSGVGVANVPTSIPLNWENLGPAPINNAQDAGSQAATGRVTSVAVDPTDPNTIYIATAGGGAWKTKNGGLTWTSIFDFTTAGNPSGPLSGEAALYAGAIAVAPSDPQVIYLGTGEGNNNTDCYYGTGVYKSTDAGQTWTLLTDPTYTDPFSGLAYANPLYGLASTKIVVDPYDPNLFYVATTDLVENLPATSPDLLNQAVSGTGEVGVWRYGGQSFTIAPSGVPGATEVGNTVTITTTAANTFLVGQQVTISGVGLAGYDGIFTITATPTATSFTYTNSVLNLADSGGGRVDLATWYNMTAHVSFNRATTPTGYLGSPLGFPGTPGPDDDYRISYPQENAAWSDLALVYADTANWTPLPEPVPREPELFAALGTYTGDWNNGVYHTENPTTTSGTGPIWYVGSPVPNPPPGPGLEYNQYNPGVPNAAPDNRSANEFPTGLWNPLTDTGLFDQFGFPVYRDGVIKLTAVVTPYAPGSGVTPRQFSNVTVFAAVTYPLNIIYTDFNFNKFFNFFPTNVAGTLEEIDVSTFNGGLNGGGLDWTQMVLNPATVQNYQGIPNINTITGEGWYASSIVAADANTLYIGSTGDGISQEQIWETTNALAPIPTFQDISVDGNNNGPFLFQHAMALDSSNRLLVANDGGVWRYDSTTNLWTDLNGNLGAALINGVAVDPTNPNVVYASGKNTGVVTINNGVTNSPVGTHIQSGTGGQIHTYEDPLTGQVTVYADINGNLFSTTNGFATTTNLYAGNIPGFPFLVGSDPSGSVRLVEGGSPPNPANPLITVPLIESTNNGTSWVSLNAPVAITSTTAVAEATYQGVYQADPAFPGLPDVGANTVDPDTIYIAGPDAATGFSDVFVTKNNGLSWVNRSAGLPPGFIVTSMAVDPTNRDTIYLTGNVTSFGVLGNTQFTQGYVLESTNAGQSWTDITGRTGTSPLPNVPQWSVAYDSRSGNLYVGNDNGVWVLLPGGTPGVYNWQTFGAGMPNVQVHYLDLNQSTNTLTAATYGRGVFELFLDSVQANSGALRAASGQSQWVGSVQLLGDPAANIVTITANGISQPTTTSNASLNIAGTISDYTRLVAIAAGTAGATESANTVTITTTAAHGFVAGQTVTIAGVSVAGYNGTFTITSVPSATTFTYTDPASSLANSGNGTVTNLSRTIATATEAGTTVTITTTTPHGLFVGETVNISGASVAGYNGTFTVTAVGPGPNPTTFTYTDTTPALAPSGGGTVTTSPRLVKTGVGDIILSGTNTYSGVTEVQQGQLIIQNPYALGNAAAASNTIVDNGSSLVLQSNLFQEPVQLNGNGFLFNGHYQGALYSSTNNNTYTGTLTLNTNTTIGVGSGNTLTIGTGIGMPGSGIITAPSTQQLNKEGTGTLILNTVNTYTGITQVNEGVLDVQAGTDATGNSALGSPAGRTDVLDGAALWIARNAVLATQGIFVPTIVTTELLTLSGTGINGTGALLNVQDDNNPNGSNNNAWLGSITLKSNPYILIPSGAAATSPPPDVAIGVSNPKDTLYIGKGPFQGQGGAGSGQIGQGSVSFTIAAAGVPGATELGNTVTITTTAAHGFAVGQTVTIAGVSVAGYNGIFTITSVPSATTFTYTDLALGLANGGGGTVASIFGLIKVGEGRLTLNQANTYTGGTIVSQGELRIQRGSALGTLPNAGTVVKDGAALETDGDPNGLGNTMSVSGQAVSLAGTGAPDVQTITVTGTTGFFQLTFNGQSTPSFGPGTLAYNATAQQIQQALDGLTSIANNGGGFVTVTQIGTAATGNVFTVIFGGSLSQSDQPLITAPLLGIQPTLVVTTATLQDGSTGALRNVSGNNTWTGATGNVTLTADSNFQTLAVTGTSGTFTLSFNGMTTAALPYNAAPAVIQAALNGLATMVAANSTVVVAPAGNTDLITFQGSLAGNNPPVIVAIGYGGATASVSVLTDAIGVDPATQLTVSSSVQDPSPVPVPAASLTKVGTGTLVFPTANPYTGKTFVNNGILSVQNSAALGMVSRTIAAVGVPGAVEAGNTVTITTTAAHDYQVGQTVTISGVTGVYGITANGATENVTTVTITTTVPHGLTVGQTVVIANVAPVAGYNGTFVVTGTPTATSFTYTTAAGLANSGGGMVTAPSAAAYNGTFTITAVPSATTFTYTDSTSPLPNAGGGAVSNPEVQLITLTGSGGAFNLTFTGPLTNTPANNSTIAAVGVPGATELGNAVTITTTAAHGYAIGQMVIISCVGVAGYNGTFTITGKTATTFTYTDPISGLANSGGGVVSPVPGPLAYNSTIAAAPTGATEAGHTVTITTTAVHDFAIGQIVTIAGVGVAGYNGTFTITGITATTFTYTDPTAGLANSGGGTVSLTTTNIANPNTTVAASPFGATEAGNTVTILTTTPHGYLVGDLVQISGVGGGYDGDYLITAVPTPTSFTYTNPAAGLAAAGGGTVVDLSNMVTAIRNALNALPSISNGGTGSVSVAPGSALNSYLVTFQGSLALSNLPQMTAQGIALPNPVVTTVEDGPEGTVVNSGGTLQLQGNVTVSTEALTLNGQGFNSYGALQNPSGSNNGWNNNPIILGSDASFGVGTPEIDTVTVGGSTTGTFSLTFNGQSTLTTSGPLPYGATAAQVQAALQSLSTVGYNNIIGASPTGATEAGNTVTITTTAAHGFEVGQIVQINGVSAGYNGTFTITSVPTPTTFTYTDSTAGLAATGGGTASIGGTVYVSQVGNVYTIQLGGTLLGTFPAGLSATGACGTTAFAVNVASGSGAVNTLTIAQPIVDNGNGFGITKYGPGTVAYTGGAGTDNTYTGVTNVYQGTLLLNKSNNTTALAGSLTIGTGQPGTTPNNAIVQWLAGNQVGDSATVTVNYDGKLNLNGQTETINQLNVLDGNATLGTNGQLTVSSLNMQGGTITLPSAGSTLFLAGIGVPSDVTATSDARTGTATISGSGTLNLSGTTRLFTVNAGTQGVDLDVAVPIGGGIGLTKNGNGRLQLASVNTYPGSTFINNGDVQVDGSIANVQLNGGSVSGKGTVGTITGNGSPAIGTIDPGDNGTATPYGTLTSNGTNLWANTTTFFVDLRDNTLPGTDFDQLLVKGDLNLNNATLTGSAAANIPLNETFTILKTTGTLFNTGTFAGIAQGGALFLNANKFIVTYNYGVGGSVVLQKVKENVTLSVGSVPNPSVYGAAITFTATVVPENGDPIPAADTVTFSLTGPNGFFATTSKTLTSNAATLDPSTLNGGNPLNAGTYTLSVTFSGDANNFVSAGPVTLSPNQVVTKALTLLTGSFDPSVVSNSAVWGQTVTLTTTVSRLFSGFGSPSGSVTFVDVAGSTITTLGTVSLNSSGQASVVLGSLTVGSHTIRVSYLGDTNFQTAGPVGFGLDVLKNTASFATTVSTTPSSPSFLGQTVSFTASLVPTSPPGFGTPTGTVRFYDGPVSGGTLLGFGTLSSGSVTFSTAALTVGSHTITVSYQGDTHFASGPSSTTTVPYSVSPDNTSTSPVTSSLNPSGLGQPVTFMATVANLNTSSKPTGNVIFVDSGSGATLGLNALNTSGVASISDSLLTFGTHTILAYYQGTNNFAASDDSLLSPLLQQVRAASTTKISSVPGTSYFGQSVTFTATVTLSSGSPVGDTVTFVEGSTTLGSPTTLNSSGQASITINPPFSVGTHTISVQYSGDPNAAPSTANPPVVLFVTKDPTLISPVQGTPSGPVTIGTTETFTTTVSAQSPGSGTPSGTVSFYDGPAPGGVLLGSTLLSGGVATLTTSLSAGTYHINAQYTGDGSFLSQNTTSGLVEVVTKIGTGTTFTPPLPPSPSVFGQTLTYTISVTPALLGNGTPSGIVVFRDGSPTGLAVGTATLDNSGAGTVSISTLTAGTHNIFAQYQGDNTFSPSNSSSPLTQAVSQDSTTFTTVTGSPSPSLFGQTVLFTTSLAAQGPGSGTPTGFVTFSDGTSFLGLGTLNGGVATFATSSLSVTGSPHTINVQYSGDANFSSTTGSTTQTVTVNTNTSVSSSGLAAPGQTVTFTASVSSVAGIPNGIVTFSNGALPGGTTLGTATLSNSGVATFTTNALTSGTYAVFANYNYLGTSSASFNPSSNSVSLGIGVSSSNSSSTYGETVTFTASITGSPGNPTGTVSFYDGASLLGNGTLTSIGSGLATATFATNSLQVSGSPHTINATYNGNSFFSGITNSTPQTVNDADTTLSVTGPGFSVLTQMVTFAATVTSSTIPPTGSVTFYDGAINPGSSIGTGNLTSVNGTSGVATFPTNGLLQGTHTIFAQYQGDETTDFDGSSNSVTQTVANGTSVSVTSNATTIPMYGQTVAFTASVNAGTSATGTPSGTVTFIDTVGSTTTTLGTQVLTSISSGLATATLPTNALSAGTHTIIAQYNPNPGSNFIPNSGNVTQVVQKANTNITPASVPNPSNVGATVTFKATVVNATSPGTGTPTGSVTFIDTVGSTTTTLGTTLLVGGVATFATSSLSAGTHTISLQYSGDANFSSSSDPNALSQTVNKIGTSTSLSPSSGTSSFGQTVTYQVSITPATSSSFVPSGTVTLYDGLPTLGHVLGSTTFTGVVAFVSTSSLSVNTLSMPTHSIYVQYSGDVNFSGGLPGGPVFQVVSKATPTVQVNSSAINNNSNVGDLVTFTATVNPHGAGTPTGIVTFYSQAVGGTVLKSVTLSTLSGGVVSFSTNTLKAGSYNITAQYTHDTASSSNFNSSLRSAPVPLTVTDTVTTLKAVVSPTPLFVDTGFNLTVTALDALGSKVPGYSAPNQATVTLFSFVDPNGISSGGTLSSLGTSLSSPGITIPFSQGAAKLSNIKATLAGTYTVLITSGTLQTMVTFTVNNGSGRQH